MKEEIWKPIPGYEGYYEISNTGKVKSLTRTIIDSRGISHNVEEKELILPINNVGYKTVSLRKIGVNKTFLVHRLVAIVFILNPNNLPIVNHKDENKLNNNVDNLEWCTYEYNNNYGTGIERRRQKTIKPVIMCDKNTKEKIKIFESVSEASEKTGITLGNISKVCKGERNSAGGYFWEYA